MDSSPDSRPHQVVNAFLSHSYKEHAANLFFYELISEVADFGFRVDEGKYPTSTTRLERMIRDADVFVGFWPLPGDPQARWPADRLGTASRYFRLELDIAIRARKSGIVFCDTRYGNLFRTPPEILRLRFDPQELAHRKRSPSWTSLLARVESFWDSAAPRLTARPFERAAEDGRVGLLIAPGTDAASAATAVVSAAGFDPVELPWPPVLSPATLVELRRCDWVVAELGDPAVEAMTAFLHGQFVPLLRIAQGPAHDEPSTIGALLYGTLEVGYRKDVARWSTPDELRTGLEQRLEVICHAARLVVDRATAIEYFSSAGKRHERVFLSYAGKDRDPAARFADELRNRFYKVFDYRDQGSIQVGQPWRTEIVQSIKDSTIGVILFSESYPLSKVCVDEAGHLLSLDDTPLLIVGLDTSDPPDFLANYQYIRATRGTPAQLIDGFLAGLA